MSREHRKKIGAKDVNGKEICVGDRVEMHFFVEQVYPVPRGRYEHVYGVVNVDCWGTYTELDDGTQMYWLDCLESIEDEVEVVV